MVASGPSSRTGRPGKSKSQSSGSRSRSQSTMKSNSTSAKPSSTRASSQASTPKGKTFSQKLKKAYLRSNNPDQVTTRRHRYESFNTRLTKINVDPLRLARTEFLRAEEEAEEANSYFRAALDRWKVTNLSKNFSELAYEVNHFSETLPQIIYHEQKIFDCLISRVENGDVLSLEPLLNLTSSLAHDLGVRFAPFVDRTVAVLAGLVLKHTDVEVVEWTFACLVWLFKYLSRMLVQRLPEVYKLVEAMLGTTHKKEFVAHFSAEALAFLLRKATSRFDTEPEHLRGTLSCCVDTLYHHFSGYTVLGDGIAVLLIESIRGINQALHSHGPLIITEFTTIALRHAATLKSSRPIADFFGSFLTRLASELSPQGYEHAITAFLSVFEEEATLIKESPEAARIAAESLFAIVQKLRTENSSLWEDVLQTVFNLISVVGSVESQLSLTKYQEMDVDTSSFEPEVEGDGAPTSFSTILSALAVALCRSPIGVAISSKAGLACFTGSNAACRSEFVPFALLFIERCTDSRFKDILLPCIQSYINLEDCWEAKELTISVCSLLAEISREGGRLPSCGATLAIPISLQERIETQLKGLATEKIEVNDEVLALTNVYLGIVLSPFFRLPLDSLKSPILSLVERGLVMFTNGGDSITSRAISLQQILSLGNAFRVAASSGYFTIDAELVSRVCNASSRFAGSQSFWEGLKTLLALDAPSPLEDDLKDAISSQFTVASTILSKNPPALRALSAGLCIAAAGPSHPIRLLSLEIAQLIRRTKPDYSSDASPDLLELMLGIESTPPNIHSIREVAMDLQRIGAGYSKLAGVDKVSESSTDSEGRSEDQDSEVELVGPHADDILLRVLIPAFCFGMLSSEIAQTCNDAVTTLQTICDEAKMGENIVAETAFAWIRDVRYLNSSTGANSSPVSPPGISLGGTNTSRQTAARAATGEDESARRRLPAELREVLFSASTEDYVEKMKSSFDQAHITPSFRVGRREQALKVLTKIPKTAERRAREIVGVLIGWGEADDDDIADPLDETDDQQTSGDTAAYDSRSWSMIDKKLLLGLFAQFTNPRSLYRSSAVNSALLSLLSSGDLDVQRSALRAILTWKTPSVAAHSHTLLGLLDEAQFRERVALLVGADSAIDAANVATSEGSAGMSSVEGVLLAKDRPAVMHLAVRVLFGRAISRAGRGGQQGRRRRAVLGALARCETTEISEFVMLSLGKLGKINLANEQIENNKDGTFEVDTTILDGKTVINERKQNGILGLTKDLVSVFGGTLPDIAVVEVAKSIMYIVLHGQANEGVTEDDDALIGEEDEEAEAEMDENGTTGASVRRIRARALRLLASLFHHYPSIPVWPAFLPSFFARIVSPRLPRLATEATSATAASSGLFRVFAEWSNTSVMAGWLIEYDTSVIACLANLLESKVAHGNVKKVVLQNIISSLARVAEGEAAQAGGSDPHDGQDVMVDVEVKPQSVAAFILASHAGLLLRAISSLLAQKPDLSLTEAAVDVVVQLAPYADASCDASTLVSIAAAIARERDIATAQPKVDKAEIEEVEIEEDGNESDGVEDEDDEDDQNEGANTSEPTVGAIEATDITTETTTAEIAPLKVDPNVTPRGPSKRRIRIPFRLRITCLRILLKYIPSASLSASSPLTALLISDLASLFSDLDGVSNRILLCEILSVLAVSTVNSNLILAAELSADLNAYARLGAPNFDRRLEGLRRLAEDNDVIQELGTDGWKLILGTCLFTIRTHEDMALRAASTLATRRFIKLAKDTEDPSATDATPTGYLTLIERSIIPTLRRGVHHRDEAVRIEFVVLLSSIVSAFPVKGTSVSCLSSLLMAGDVEASVFDNILHIQPHRRIRAIKRLAEHATTHEFSSGATVGVLIPLLDAFVPWDERNDASNAVDGQEKKMTPVATEALGSIAILVHRLTWSALRSGIERQRKGLKQPIPGRFFIKRLKVWLDGFAGWLDIAKQKDQLPVESTSISYIRTIYRPMSDFFHKQSDDTVDGRLALLGPLARLLHFLPQAERDTRMSTLLTDVSNILRSRSMDVRDHCRTGINEVLAITGPEGLDVLIISLKTALQRGYQRHVLGYTLHSALVSLTPRLVPGDLDGCAAEISSLCIEDVLGMVGEEKNAPDYVGKMKEVRSQKGYDALEVLSRLLSPSAVKLVLGPLREMILESTRLATRISRRLDELLRRIGMGLAINEALQSEAGMVLCHELLTTTINKTMVTKNVNSRAKMSATTTNAPKMIVFGLDLLRSLLRRTPELRSARLLTGLIPGACDAAISTNSDVQAAAMRLITGILGYGNKGIPALDSACPVLVAEAVRTVESSPTTTADIAQAAIKLIGAILRYRQSVPIKQVHLAYILRRIKPDLAEPDRHGLPFTLVRAVISRKIVMPELYDVMDSVASIMVTNHTRTLRDAAAAAYLHFIADCPQTRDRFGQQIAFFVANLDYKHQEGRQTIMEILHLVLTKFSDELVQEEVIERVFVPIVLVMVNDDSEKCRAMAGLLVRDVFARAGQKTNAVVSLLHKWMGDDRDDDDESDEEEEIDDKADRLLMAALKLWVILLETREDLYDEWIPFLIRRTTALLTKLTRPLAITRSDVSSFDSEGLADQWSVVFHTLLLVEKVCAIAPALAAEQRDLWKAVVLTQKFPHQWVKGTGMKLVSSLLLAPLVSDSLDNTSAPADDQTAGDIEATTSPFAQILSAEDLRDITDFSLRTMRVDDVSEEVVQRACRNVFLLSRYYANVIEKESGGDDDDDGESSQSDSDDSDDEDNDEQRQVSQVKSSEDNDATITPFDRSTPKAILSHIFDQLSRVIRSESAARTVVGLQGKQAALLLVKNLVEISNTNSSSNAEDAIQSVNPTISDDRDFGSRPKVSVLAKVAARNLLRPLWTITNTGAAETENKGRSKSYGATTTAVVTLASAREATLVMTAETLATIQSVLGSATYIEMLQQAKSAAMKTRQERRTKRKIDQVKNPEKAERDKKRKRQGAKRRQVEKGSEWRSHRRGW